MAIASVIFSIGSKLGPGGLASLQSGIQMALQLGRAVAENVKQLNDFSEQYQKLQIDISAADKASGGLIDTLTIIKKTNQVTASGIKLTSEQLKNMSKFAADFAQKAGLDATAQFEKLMTAIQKGRTFTLKEFGIEVTEGGDRMEAFRSVMEQVTLQAEELNDVLAKTNSEALFALQNNVETTAGLIWDKFMGDEGMVEAATGFNETLGELNEVLMDQESQVNDTLFSWKNLAFGAIDELTGLATALNPIMDGTQLQSRLWADAVSADRKRVQDEQWENIRLERELQSILEDFTGGPITEHVPLPGEKAKGAPKPKRRGGGRRRREEPGDTMDFTVEETLSSAERVDMLLAQEADKLRQEELDHAQQLIDLEQQKIDLRSTEISQGMQMRDMQAQMQELAAAGVDVSGVMSDFGTIATEENNQLKQERMDLAGQELDLLFDMNAEKIAGLEAQKRATQELTAIQKFGNETQQKAFDILGRTAGAYFGSLIGGAAMSGEAIKNMIADLAKNEAILSAIQSVKALGSALWATAMGLPTAPLLFESARNHAFAAAAFGGLAASLGGGKGGAASAPSSSVAGAVGPATEGFVSGASVGGGDTAGGPQEVVVILQGDTDRLFTVIQAENRTRRDHSLSTLEE